MSTTGTPTQGRLARLLGRVIERDAVALGELFDLTFASSWRVAQRCGGRNQDANTLVESAYWLLWREAPRCAASGMTARQWLRQRIEQLAREAGATGAASASTTEVSAVG